MKQPPVKLVCKRLWLDVGDDMKVCKWKRPREGATAQFRARWRKDWYAILRAWQDAAHDIRR